MQTEMLFPTDSFSQVTFAELGVRKPFKRFPVSSHVPITRLKPGVNENMNLLSGHHYQITQRSFSGRTMTSPSLH